MTRVVTKGYHLLEMTVYSTLSVWSLFLKIKGRQPEHPR